MSTKNIGDLRDVLFEEIEHVKAGGNLKEGGAERTRLIIGLSGQLLDSARIEVGLAAVMRAQLSVPFIEEQAEERPASQDPEALPAPGKTAPLDRILHGGPAATHPWRGVSRKSRT